MLTVTPEWIEARSEPELNSGCRLWSKTCFPHGYGKSSSRAAHRLAWEAYHGPIPEGQHVLHRCDTPACVNPAHLYLGSHSRNMRDMCERGRGPKSKLGVAQVEAIRADRKAGVPARALARSFGVTPRSIYRVVRGDTWTPAARTTYVRSPDRAEVVCGPMSDALHAKCWGKLEIGNTPVAGAEVLTADELSDFIDFHVLNRVGAGTRHRYEAGAARWAARASGANDNALIGEAA